MLLSRTAILLGLFAALPAAVLADLSITFPVAGSSWSPSTAASISWAPFPAGATYDSAKTYAVDLMRGNPQALVLVATLAQSVSEAQGGLSGIRLLGDWGSGNDFVVRVGDKYSHAFGIYQTSAGGSPAPPPPAAPGNSGLNGRPGQGVVGGSGSANGTLGAPGTVPGPGAPGVSATTPGAPAPRITTTPAVNSSAAAVERSGSTIAVAALVPIIVGVWWQ